MREIPTILAALSAAAIPTLVCEGAAAQAPVQATGSALDKSPAWRQVVEFYRDATTMAKGQSTQAQRTLITARQKDAEAQVAQLQKDGLITAAEQGLLVNEFERVRSDIHSRPPTPTRNEPMVSCYMMAALPPGEPSLGRLTRQVAALEKQAKGAKLSPEVVQMVVGPIEADIAVLSNPAVTKDMKPAEKANIAKLVKQARELLAATRK